MGNVVFTLYLYQCSCRVATALFGFRYALRQDRRGLSWGINFVAGSIVYVSIVELVFILICVVLDVSLLSSIVHTRVKVS